MDNNNDDGLWMYNPDHWMDVSLFHPLSVEPVIEVMEGTETSAASSYLVDCGVEGERAFLVLPFTPPSSPPPPLSSPPPSLPSPSTARPQTSPPPATATGFGVPNQRIRKTIKNIKDKPTPKYELDPNNPRLTVQQRASIIKAIKCRKERLKKEEEKKSLTENNDRLANQIAVMTEQLQAEKVKIKSLQQEIVRRGHVILALALSANANESPA